MTSGFGIATDVIRPPWQRGVMREAVRASDSYGLLLLLVSIDYIVLSVGWSGGVPAVIGTALLGITALLAFHTSHVRGHLLKAVQVAALLAFVSSIVATIVGGNHGKGAVFIISALLILSCPVVVLTRILRHRQVTVETLLGAVSVYILFGLVFTYLDYAVQLVGGRSFFAQAGAHTAPDFVYYSFITITTVGYGDLSPAMGVPRTMAVLEALTGQIFLVVLVARLVSIYQPRPRGARLRSLEDGTDVDAVGSGRAGSDATADASIEGGSTTSASESDKPQKGDAASES